MGFGEQPEKAPSGPGTFAPNWGGSLWLVADAFGIKLDRIETQVESCAAPKTFTTPGGLHVAAGTIGARHWRLTGLVNGSPFLVTSHVSRVGAHMAPNWPWIGGPGGFQVSIEGSPPLRSGWPLGLEGGTGTSLGDAVLMTAARCVNAVPSVVNAPAGYRLLTDLPIIGERYRESRKQPNADCTKSQAQITEGE